MLLILFRYFIHSFCIFASFFISSVEINIKLIFLNSNEFLTLLKKSFVISFSDFKKCTFIKNNLSSKIFSKVLFEFINFILNEFKLNLTWPKLSELIRQK